MFYLLTFLVCISIGTTLCSPFSAHQSKSSTTFHQNIEDSTNTFLEAVKNGDLDQVQKLIDDQSADVNDMALSYASKHGHDSIVSLLLEYGANVNTTNAGKPPLYLAAHDGHEKVEKILIEHGAFVNYVDVCGTSSLSILDWAIFHDQTEIVELLIEKGAKTNYKSPGGRDALSQAIFNGNKKIVELLIINGDVHINTPNAIGRTPLFQALSIGAESIAVLLIEYGANITFTDRSLKTPLHLAAQYSKTNNLDRLVKKIIDAGVNIDVPDNNGNSPLSEAARAGSEQVVRLLIETGADINLANKDNKTPLDLANENGQSKISTFLIEAGAKLE